MIERSLEFLLLSDTNHILYIIFCKLISKKVSVLILFDYYDLNWYTLYTI